MVLVLLRRITLDKRGCSGASSLAKLTNYHLVLFLPPFVARSIYSLAGWSLQDACIVNTRLRVILYSTTL